MTELVIRHQSQFSIDWRIGGLGGILALIVMGRIFSKAGKNGWTVLIPLYNIYAMFDIVYGEGPYALMMLIPVVNIFIGVKLMFNLAKCFGKGTLFGIGTVILPIIFLPILAFGGCKYEGPVKE